MTLVMMGVGTQKKRRVRGTVIYFPQHTSDSPTGRCVMRPSILAFVLCVTVCGGTAQASSIGVFADAAASDCDITISAPAQFTFYVFALLGGDVAGICGLRRADYRLTGVPADWFTIAVPSPAGSAEGNILVGGGSIDFSGCLAGPIVLLHTVVGFATTTALNFQIRPAARIDVTDACSPTTRPTLTVCDQDVTRLCVFQSELFVNAPFPCGHDKPVEAPVAGGTCLVAIESQTWGGVKQLYDD